MYRKILTDEADVMKNGNAKVPVSARRMLTCIIKYEDETLLFMYDFAVPFTNNLALFLQINYSEHIKNPDNTLKVTRNAQNNLRMLNQAI
jgi:hypothetical protein